MDASVKTVSCYWLTQTGSCRNTLETRETARLGEGCVWHAFHPGTYKNTPLLYLLTFNKDGSAKHTICKMKAISYACWYTNMFTPKETRGHFKLFCPIWNAIHTSHTFILARSLVLLMVRWARKSIVRPLAKVLLSRRSCVTHYV